MRLAPLLLAGLLMAALAPEAGAADLPPISSPSTSTVIPGKFIWADLFTTDPSAAADFYTALFGWKATPISRHGRIYTVLSDDGHPIAGVSGRPATRMDLGRARWVGYVSVRDVSRAIAECTASGGRVIFQPRDLPMRGTQAVIADPDHAVVGLLHSSSGDPGDYEAEAGEWMWAELFAREPATESQFYSKVVGYQVESDDRTGRQGDLLLTSDGYARAGLATLPLDHPGARPGWLGFIRVTDVDGAAAKAEKLGGRVLTPAHETAFDTRIAVIGDPVGAAIGLIELAASGGNSP